jgi:hypothetical protein
MPTNTVSANVTVTITKRGSNFEFAYSGGYAQPNGNLDCSVEPYNKKTVNLNFTIGSGSVPGIKFVSAGKDAMWIAPKEQTGEESPKGPYSGAQFAGFSVDAGRQRLSVVNNNDDEETYRYALRFDLDGKIVAHDPDVKNGGDH